MCYSEPSVAPELWQGVEGRESDLLRTYWDRGVNSYHVIARTGIVGANRKQLPRNRNMWGGTPFVIILTPFVIIFVATLCTLTCTLHVLHVFHVVLRT